MINHTFKFSFLGRRVSKERGMMKKKESVREFTITLFIRWIFVESWVFWCYFHQLDSQKKLVGIPTPEKWWSESQLGLWNSQLFMEVIKFHGSKHVQSPTRKYSSPKSSLKTLDTSPEVFAGENQQKPELAPWGIHHWLDITQEFPENPDVLLFTMGLPSKSSHVMFIKSHLAIVLAYSLVMKIGMLRLFSP